MDVTEALQTRYSVRGYKPDRVPEELIREVFDVARLAPSNSNTQPWHVTVVSGEVRDQLEAALCALADEGAESDRTWPPPKGSITGEYRERRRACGFGYYATMGVDRDDREGRARIARKNYEFFGAPHVAFFSMPTTMGVPSAVDMGIFLQSVMLVMHERGIGCIPQGALATFEAPVREIAGIPDGNGLVCGMSFGFEAEGELINTVRMPRESVDSITTMVG